MQKPEIRTAVVGLVWEPGPVTVGGRGEGVGDSGEGYRTMTLYV